MHHEGVHAQALVQPLHEVDVPPANNDMGSAPRVIPAPRARQLRSVADDRRGRGVHRVGVVRDGSEPGASAVRLLAKQPVEYVLVVLELVVGGEQRVAPLLHQRLRGIRGSKPHDAGVELAFQHPPAARSSLRLRQSVDSATSARRGRRSFANHSRGSLNHAVSTSETTISCPAKEMEKKRSFQRADLLKRLPLHRHLRARVVQRLAAGGHDVEGVAKVRVAVVRDAALAAERLRFLVKRGDNDVVDAESGRVRVPVEHELVEPGGDEGGENWSVAA